MYLLNNTIQYMFYTDEEATAFIEEAKRSRMYELVAHNVVHKDEKVNKDGEVTQPECYIVTLKEKFNDAKLPDTRIRVVYEVDR